MGADNVIEVLNFKKPSLGELTKVRSTDNYQRALEMIVACCDQPTIVVKRLSYEDTHALMEEFLPDFLGIEEQD
jgi:hypothetical protein